MKTVILIAIVLILCLGSLYWFPIFMNQTLSDILGIVGIILAIPTLLLVKKYQKKN